MAACATLLVCPAVSLGQDAERDQVRATKRAALLMSRFNLLVPEARPTTAVVGSVWSPENEGMPGVTVQLRDVVSGETSETTTNEAGHYTFEQVAEGTYLVEVEWEAGDLALGDIFTIRPGETVAVFVKLPPRSLTLWQRLTGTAPGRYRSTGERGNTEQQPPVPNGFVPSLPSVTSSAGSAGVTAVGGRNAASNDDQPQ